MPTRLSLVTLTDNLAEGLSKREQHYTAGGHLHTRGGWETLQGFEKDEAVDDGYPKTNQFLPLHFRFFLISEQFTWINSHSLPLRGRP